MQHNLSVNGGSDRINYYMSIGYFDQSGHSIIWISNAIVSVQMWMPKLLTILRSVWTLTETWAIRGLLIGLTIPDQELMNDMYRALLNFPSTEPAYINGQPNATIYNWNVLEAIKNGHRSKRRTP